MADKRLAADLTRLLAAGFPGIVVDVGANERWDRPYVMFRWSGFADLLPEERFHRLMAAIPEAFRTERLSGLVWLELAPRETVDAFLDLSRSEDVGGREGRIYADLLEVGFFESLATSLGRSPKQSCVGSFSASTAILVQQGRSVGQIRDAKLVFIQYGAYCDCQALESVGPALAELHAGAA